MTEQEYNETPHAIAASAMLRAKVREACHVMSRDMDNAPSARGYYRRRARRMEQEIAKLADYLIDYRT